MSATQDGRPQSDAAVAFYTDGKVYSIPEERITRKKHDGNSLYSIQYGLSALKRGINDVDRWIVSTCGEEVPSPDCSTWIRADRRLSLEDLGVPKNKIIWNPSHHQSHAYEALLSNDLPGSCKQTSLIFVADRIGQPFEKQSLFFYEFGKLRKVVDAWKGSGMGICDAYERTTGALGWHPQFDCGLTMALSGSSKNVGNLAADLFSIKRDHIYVNEDGVDQIIHKIDDSRSLQSRIQFSCVLQRSLEKTVVRFLRSWVEALKPDNLIISGGLGLNCALLGRLVQKFPEAQVRGTLIPNDHGQGVGNICWYLAETIGVLPEKLPVLPSDRSHNLSRDLVRKAAKEILSGGFWEVHQGDAEPGPRALGNRSILADPRRTNVKFDLNRRKGRYTWQPFGAVLHPNVARSFLVDSPYMSTVAFPSSEFTGEFPSIMHTDGSCRVQTSYKGRPFLRALMDYLEEKHGLNVLLNTSLNRNGEPIVL
ncbi:carbamoyltransferase C-terminal domain-containing protein [Roseobacter sp. A03A-229]